MFGKNKDSDKVASTKSTIMQVSERCEICAETNGCKKLEKIEDNLKLQYGEEFAEAIIETFDDNGKQKTRRQYISNAVPIITRLCDISGIRVDDVKYGYAFLKDDDTAKHFDFNERGLSGLEYIVLQPNNNHELIEPLSGLKFMTQDIVESRYDSDYVRRTIKSKGTYLTILKNCDCIPYGTIKPKHLESFKSKTLPKNAEIVAYLNELAELTKNSVERYEQENSIAENIDIDKILEDYKKKKVKGKNS